jgi:hypothetical protein
MLMIGFSCCRLILYRLLVRAQRLSDCWDGAGQLMSSRYADRVTISDFIYLKIWTNILFIHLHPLTLIKSTIPSSTIPSSSIPSNPNPKYPVGYPTKIITVIPFCLFFSMWVTKVIFLNCLSRHATIYSVPSFCFTI